MRRMGLRAPSATTSQSARSVKVPSAVCTVSVAPSASGCTAVTLCSQRICRWGRACARFTRYSSR